MIKKLFVSLFHYLMIVYFLLFFALDNLSLYFLIPIQCFFILMCFILMRKKDYSLWSNADGLVLEVVKIPLGKNFSFLSYPAYRVEFKCEHESIVQDTQSMLSINPKRVGKTIPILYKKNKDNYDVCIQETQSSYSYYIFIGLLFFTILITIL